MLKGADLSLVIQAIFWLTRGVWYKKLALVQFQCNPVASSPVWKSKLGVSSFLARGLCFIMFF